MWIDILLDVLGFGAVVTVGILIGIPICFLCMKYVEWVSKKLGM